MSDNRGRVRPLTPYKELRGFLDFLYGDRDGFVYAPTKDPQTGDWEKNFYRWPEQKDTVIHHFQEDNGLELYLSPSLWKTNEISYENFMGSNVVWTECDYGVLDSDQLAAISCPKPTLRIRSSTESKQHWYWRLDHFETSYKAIEEVNKRIAYSVDADLSAWDYQQVLRPPTTTNYKAARATVTTLERLPGSYGLHEFLGLPDPPQGALDTAEDLGEIPDALDVIARYKWKDAAFKAYRQNVAAVQGKRSDTLCYLAYECAEMGMRDGEIMSILLNADDRWSKFKGRNDRIKQLRGIILRARFKYPVKEVEDDFPVFGFESFLEQKYELKWVINGLIAENTVNLTSGMPKIGKSQFNLRAAICAAVGKKFLMWDIEEPKSIVFFSLEMGPTECHQILSTMAESMSREERQLLQKNFHIVPLGQSVLLNRVQDQAKFQRTVDKYKPVITFIDSLGVSVGDDLSSDKVMLPAMDFVKAGLVNQFNTSVWFIHHNRKPQVGNKKPKFLNDLYGSTFIGGTIVSGIGMWKDTPQKKEIEISCLAARLSPEWESFDVRRTEHLDYEFALDRTEVPETPQSPQGRKLRNARPNNIGGIGV